MPKIDLTRCVARFCLLVTLATYGTAVAAALRSGFSGWIFAVSEPLYWPSLLAMLVLAGQISRRDGLRPWRLWRRAAEVDLRRLCHAAMSRSGFLIAFWLNWAGAVALPLSILANLALPWQVRLLAAIEIASTLIWRLPALRCSGRRTAAVRFEAGR
jgi:hypothetical protein